MPLEDHDGSVRPVMLVVWLIDRTGAALVQPIVKGQDDPLPWGLATHAHDPPRGGRPQDGVAAYATAVEPMVMAIEALLQRGVPPADMAGRFPEALAIARVAGGARRDLGRMTGGDPPITG